MTVRAKDHSFELLREKIRELMNDYTNDLAAGACQTFEDYKQVTGKIEGLALAERELLDLDDRLYKNA